MTTLTVELVQQRLMEKDEMKKVSYQKQQLSKHRKSKEVKNIKDPSNKLTKVTQVKTPGEEGHKEDKGSNIIPQAKFAHEYTDKMPHGQGPAAGSGGTNQKSPKGTKVSSMTPNQKTNLKQVKNSIKGTEDGGKSKATVVPGEAPFAHELTDKMPHGSQTLGTSKGEGGEGLAKPSVAKMAGGPTRKGGVRTAKSLGEEPGGHKKTDQITHKGNDMPQPSDAMKWKSHDFKTETGGAHNVVETGIALKLKGKTKAVFEVVSQNVLDRMVENYAKHGYTLVAERVEPKWKRDAALMALLREDIHAKHNFVPKVHSALRKAALAHFASLVSDSHAEMYESRKEFLTTVRDAFVRIEESAEKQYLKNLEIYECQARIKLEEDTEADIALVTEATDHCMAIRQVRNEIVEEFGFDAKIEHIFVDGDKYGSDCDCDYKIRNQTAIEAIQRLKK